VSLELEERVRVQALLDAIYERWGAYAQNMIDGLPRVWPPDGLFFVRSPFPRPWREPPIGPVDDTFHRQLHRLHQTGFHIEGTRRLA